MKYYIGIDIGLAGGIVVLDPTRTIVDSHVMPVDKAGIEILTLDSIISFFANKPIMLVFEKLGPIFGTSKKTTWSMGYQVGVIKTICTMRNLAYTEVQAKVWQKEMFQGITAIHKPGKSSLDTKAMALEAMKRIYPGWDFKQGKSKKDHDGCVDALLLATYGKRKNL